MRICVDFDGVIRGKDDQPISGAIDSIKELHRDNHIIIFSVRADEIEDWLNDYNVEYDELTNIKQDDIAFFVDDHAIRFNNWMQTLDEIEELDYEYQLSK